MPESCDLTIKYAREDLTLVMSKAFEVQSPFMAIIALNDTGKILLDYIERIEMPGRDSTEAARIRDSFLTVMEQAADSNGLHLMLMSITETIVWILGRLDQIERDELNRIEAESYE